jgi:polyhydroxybutyrate depolymerase
MKRNALLILLLVFSTLTLFAGTQTAKFRYGNKMRSFIIYTPANFDNIQKQPLIINMHGFLTDKSFQFDYTELHKLADIVNCIVVYPDGLDKRWNSGTFADLNSKVDDVGFLGRLIDYMSINYNIDETRVYSTGYSAGGFMSFRVACETTNRLAAISTVGSSMTFSTFDNCSPSRPFPIMMFNGTSDPVTVYNGFFDVKPNFQVINLWKNLNSCSNSPVVEQLPNIVTNDNSRVIKETYNCADNTEVTLMKIQNGGHTWPGSKPLLFFLGNTNQDISANEEMWKFFSNYTIPENVTCDKPSQLNASVVANNYSLSWEGEAPSYTLYYKNGQGDFFFIENITSKNYNISVSSGIDNWAVASNCESGFVTWAKHTGNILRSISQNEIKIISYPNPFTDRIALQTSNKEALDGLRYTVFNMYDKKPLATGILQGDAPIINLNALNKGFYLIEVEGIDSPVKINKF